MKTVVISCLAGLALVLASCCVFNEVNKDPGVSMTIEFVGYQPSSSTGFDADLQQALAPHAAIDKQCFKLVKYDDKGSILKDFGGLMPDVEIGDDLLAAVKALFGGGSERPKGLSSYTTRVGYRQRHQLSTGNKCSTTCIHNFKNSDKAVQDVMNVLKKYR